MPESEREYLGIANSVRNKVISHMPVSYISVTDESKAHSGHAGSMGYPVSHIKVTVISEYFHEMPRLRRQQLMHKILQEEIKVLHSVSFVLHTPEENKKAAM